LHTTAQPQACQAPCSASLPPPSGHGQNCLFFVWGALVRTAFSERAPQPKNMRVGSLLRDELGSALQVSTPIERRHMEQTNGTTEPKIVTNGTNAHTAKVIEKPVVNEPPAKTFQTGRVLTRIWATPRAWGEITWRITQIRTGSESRGAGEYRSLHFEDLWDAMRGYYKAHCWIRRTERRRQRRWFGAW